MGKEGGREGGIHLWVRSDVVTEGLRVYRQDQCIMFHTNQCDEVLRR